MDDNSTSDSDSDSDSEVTLPRQKSKAQTTLGIGKYGTRQSGKRTTRNQGRQTVHYLEDSEEDYEDESCVTMSSRGRIRRLTKRARANLLGN